jgi:hypothetical protein
LSHGGGTYAACAPPSIVAMPPLSQLLLQMTCRRPDAAETISAMSY